MAYQACPVTRNRSRLQLQILRTAQHLRHPNGRARKLVNDFRRVNRDLMEPQQQRQTSQFRILLNCFHLAPTLFDGVSSPGSRPLEIRESEARRALQVFVKRH
jgi:hypothetical protein